MQSLLYVEIEALAAVSRKIKQSEYDLPLLLIHHSLQRSNNHSSIIAAFPLNGRLTLVKVAVHYLPDGFIQDIHDLVHLFHGDGESRS